MPTLRIHYSGQPSSLELDLQTLLVRPWKRIVTSGIDGATPVYYSSGDWSVLLDWSEVDAKGFLTLWRGSLTVVELDDDEYHDFVTQLNRQSINPPPAVVRGL